MKPVEVLNEKAVLAVFSEASGKAYGCCCYMRWEVTKGCYESPLISAKITIAPIKKLNIVRLELYALLMAARLMPFVTSECRYEFCKTHLIVGSEIVLSMMQKDSYLHGTFVGTKVAEIQKLTGLSQWFWIGEILT